MSHFSGKGVVSPPPHLVSQEWINAGSFKHTYRYTHTYIPMTNAFAMMPDAEMPLENLRTMYTYRLGEKAFPTPNTSNTKIESRTTKRRPNLQRAGAWDSIQSEIYLLQSAAIQALGLSAGTFTGTWSGQNSTRRRIWGRRHPGAATECCRQASWLWSSSIFFSPSRMTKAAHLTVLLISYHCWTKNKITR